MGEPYRPRVGHLVRVIATDPETTNPASYGDEGVVEHVLWFTNTGCYAVRIKDGGWALAVMPIGPVPRPTIKVMEGETGETGETGEVPCAAGDRFFGDDPSEALWIPTLCPAPTPRA